jgi:phthalate 4,5-dioxygenase reductase subunit
MEDVNKKMSLIVSRKKFLAKDIEEFTLIHPDGQLLPSFTPGSHITIVTPSGASRRYSLVNDGDEPDHYKIAIKLEANSRGGSTSMHEQANEGTTLMVGSPENEFELVAAPKYLLIAGGIGITPILAMARHLTAEGKSFKLVYCTRSPEETAYLNEVSEFRNAYIHHDNGDIDEFYDFWDHFETPGVEHIYCCGPAPMMEEIKALSGHWPEGRVHFEDFNGVEAVRVDDTPFTIRLLESGREVLVPADRTILEALRDAGESIVSSCESGTCGTCKCRLIEGEVDHRDLVLMDDEKNDYIMLCVSRAKSGELVVGL